MIPADIDHGLRSAEAATESLDDGFSPPPPSHPDPLATADPVQPEEAALGTKSPF